MILSRRVALNGAQLDEISPWIVIRSVDAGVSSEDVSATSRMGGAGQRMTSQHWTVKDVKVTWAIDIGKEYMAERRAIYDEVVAWAMQKGWLTVSYMEGKRMYVDKTVLPSFGDPWAWTNEFTFTFRAYNIPFWQDDTPASVVNANVTSGYAMIGVPGHVETVLDVSFKNISGRSIPNISFSANGNTLTFTGVNLAANQTIEISHGTDGTLRAYRGSASVYGLMTGSDDLFVNPGNVVASVSATRAGRFTVQAYGRYV